MVQLFLAGTPIDQASPVRDPRHPTRPYRAPTMHPLAPGTDPLMMPSDPRVEALFDELGDLIILTDEANFASALGNYRG